MLNSKSITFIILILLLATPVLSQTESTLFSLDYLTKIKVFNTHPVDQISFNERIDFIKIQKEADIINISNSDNLNISYTRYSEDDSKKLFKDISFCNLDSYYLQKISPDTKFDVIILNFPKKIMKRSQLIIYLDYYLPQETESIKMFRNYFSLGDKNSDEISFLLPKNTKIWHSSIDFDSIEEKDNQLKITWNKLENQKLFFTYGTTSEYIFHENKKDSLLNNFTTTIILLFTFILSFSLYIKQTKTYMRILDSLYIVYLFSFAVICLIFIILGITQEIIPPFSREYYLGFLVRIGLIAVISVASYFFIKKTKILFKI